MKRIFFILSMVTGFSGQAQDALFTQFHYAPVNLNPALAGTGKNNLRLSGVSKIQWFNLYKPYKYASAAADFSYYDDAQRNVLNMAVNIDHSSKGYISNTAITGVVGRTFGTNNAGCSDWFLSLALQAGYNFAKVNPDQFVFIDQLDQTGITGDPSQVDLFKTFNTKNYFDFSSGAVFTIKDLMLGLSVHHMNEPNTSFNGKPEDGKLPRKVTAHVSYYFDKNDIRLKPTLITHFQGKSSALIAGVLVDYNDFPIELGCWYRNTVGFTSNNAFSFGFTWKWGQSTTVTSRKREYGNKMGISYDADMIKPGLNTTHGSMEWGIQKDIKINDNLNCPTSSSGICTFKYPWEFF